MPSAIAPRNGKPVDRRRTQHLLTDVVFTQGYRPSAQVWGDISTDPLPTLYLYRDVERMLLHPAVEIALEYFKAGISGAEFDVSGPSPEVNAFALEQCQKFWDVGVPQLQYGYEYGWVAAENRYDDATGPMRWEGCEHFAPRDSYLLTRLAVPVGVRVKNVYATGEPEAPVGDADLWLASEDVPAKGLWYGHRLRHNRYYGRSQLLAAWKPWRRAATKDAAETVLDGGCYRYLWDGGVLYYPEEDVQTATANTPATTQDSDGGWRRYGRDTARQMLELTKTGAGMGFPSTMYPPEMGGGRKWEYIHPQNRINLAPAIEYVEGLYKQIAKGVGVPPELMEAAETGSGYSGRRIPLEAFLYGQQKIADCFLHLFLTQVLRPLVRWNFGPAAKFDAKVLPLILSKSKVQMGQMSEKRPDQEGNPRGADQTPKPPQQPPQQQEHPGMRPYTPAAFSVDPLLFTDRVREIARKVLGKAA